MAEIGQFGIKREKRANFDRFSWDTLQRTCVANDERELP
jgi:hypothetical protein